MSVTLAAADPCSLIPQCAAGKKAAGAVIDQGVSKLGDSALDKAAEFFQEAAESAIKTLTTAWLKTPDPDLDSKTSPAVWLQDRLEYLVIAAMIATLFVAAIQIATTPSWQHVGGAAKALFRTIVAATAGLFLISTALAAGDEYADWILKQADINLSKELAGSGALFAQMNPGLLLVFALLMVVIQIVQVILMIVRNAAVVYLAATLPLAAASSASRSGEQWWVKSVAWLIAFILYKPVAASIYALAFRMLDGSNNIVTQITGVVACVLAIVALPAMMRLMVPATAQVASGNAATTVLGLAGGAAATGAVIASGGSMAAFAGGFSGGGGGAMAGAGSSGPPTGARSAGGGDEAGPSTPPAKGASGGSGSTSPGGLSPTETSDSGGSSGGGGGAAAAGLGADAVQRITDDSSGALGEDNR